MVGTERASGLSTIDDKLKMNFSWEGKPIASAVGIDDVSQRRSKIRSGTEGRSRTDMGVKPARF